MASTELQCILIEVEQLWLAQRPWSLTSLGAGPRISLLPPVSGATNPGIVNTPDKFRVIGMIV